jgi:WD40 repeat protein
VGNLCHYNQTRKINPNMFPTVIRDPDKLKNCYLVSHSILSEYESEDKPLIRVGDFNMNLVTVVKYHPNLTIMMFGCQDGTVHISDGNSCTTYMGHTSLKNCICEMGTRELSRGPVWNSECRNTAHTSAVYDGVFSKDGTRMYTISKFDQRILKWNIDNPTLSRPTVIQQRADQTVYLNTHGYVALHLSEERNEIIALRIIEDLFSGNLVDVFAMDTGAQIRIYKEKTKIYYYIWAGVVVDTEPVSVVYTSRNLKSISCNFLTEEIRDDGSTSNVVVQKSSLRVTNGHIQCMALSTDHKKIAIGTTCGSVLVFKINADVMAIVLDRCVMFYGHFIKGMKRFRKQCDSCACATRNVKNISKKCSLTSHIGVLCCCETKRNEETCLFKSHHGVVNDLEFSKSGKKIISFGDGDILERTLSDESCDGIVDSDIPMMTTSWRLRTSNDEGPMEPDRRLVFRVPNHIELVKRGKFKAFAMGLLPRLGENSCIHQLDPDLVKMIAGYV